MTTSCNGHHQLIVIQRPRGDKPYLLPFNRRLRHLRGVSFRNLAFPYTPQRARGQTIDDDALPYALSSPAKLLALNEDYELAHSKSSDNLKSGNDSHSPIKSKGSHKTNGHAIKPVRKVPRRNTAEWLGSSPKQRQQKAEEALARHTGDIFFSVHTDGGTDPLYVSEIAEGKMNYDFRCFDLNAYGVETICQDRCVFKFWARHNDDSPWVLLLTFQLSFRYLTFVGRSLDEFYYHLPDNVVFIYLSDGIYAPDGLVSSLDDDDTLSTNTIQSPTKPLPNAELTSSYDALMRLSTLDTCIQDVLMTQGKLAQEIADLVENGSRVSKPNELDHARDEYSSIEHALTATRNEIFTLQRNLSSRRTDLSQRHETTKTGAKLQDGMRAAYSSRTHNMRDRKTQHTTTLTALHGQRRRLATDLHTIYPIEPLNKVNTTHPLAFTIRHIPLANSNFSTPNLSAATVSTALGHAAHATHLLSLYLAIPLPYPITPHASTSAITDPISLLPPSQSRTFPLHVHVRSDDLASASGSAAFRRFEYGVFLLNKNIEALSSRLGVKVLDIRHTLPNLKYVFLVATAGKGEVPKRVVGGIRGLLASGGASRESSRRGSEESAGEAGRAAEEVRKRLMGLKEGGLSARGKGKEHVG